SGRAHGHNIQHTLSETPGEADWLISRGPARAKRNVEGKEFVKAEREGIPVVQSDVFSNCRRLWRLQFSFSASDSSRYRDNHHPEDQEDRGQVHETSRR